MAELKTKETNASVDDFLAAVKSKETQDDCRAIIKMMQKATGAKAKMWGNAIVGFGNCVLKYDSGRELDWFICGFSPRTTAIAFYIHSQNISRTELLKKLGKHKTSKGCLYIKKLADVDVKVLAELIQMGVKEKKQQGE